MRSLFRPASRWLLLGLAAGVAQADVVINEVHYNPTNKMNRVEFVELYNNGTNTEALAGWAFTKGITFAFPTGTLLATNAYLIVGENPQQISNKYAVAVLGMYTGRLSTAGETIELKNAATQIVDSVTYQLGFPWPTVGDNDFSIQLLNPFVDNDLGANWRSAAPTPHAVNSVALGTNSVPPAIRQVGASPKQPVSGEDVLLTAKITDDAAITNVTLYYQLVDPGAYISILDPAYVTTWTAVAMRDDGAAGDAVAGDSVYTTLMPGSFQTNRRLVRYRIRAVDARANAVTVPYADDPQSNFAYFVYDGVPAWTGAVQPGVDPLVTYGTNVTRSIQAYHFIARASDVQSAVLPPTTNQYWLEEYPWPGTLVVDGEVYDHVHFRARGGVWRYSMGKNMWKISLNRGHYLQAEDNYGKKYDTLWDNLNLGACIQQGDYGHRGEQGMFESTGFRLFELAGLPASKTHWIQLHVIDAVGEAGPTQYDGDLWGLYLVVEQVDGHFLDEHGLPDGNLYKMEGGSGELNNMGPYGPADKSDLNAFMTAYSSSPAEVWWRTNVDCDAYYAFLTITDGIHHYDIGAGKNYFYYRTPNAVTNAWGVGQPWTLLPWDLDLTWADSMYDCGPDPFERYGPFMNPATTVNLDFRNRIRELRDLLFNTNETCRLIDEQAAIINPSGQATTFADVDRALWDYNPIMTNGSIINPSKAGQGRFYQITPTKSFEGMVQLMKDYVAYRGSSVLDPMCADTNIPVTPVVAAVGTNAYPVDLLRFSVNAFSDPQGTNTFAALEWRLGEITDPAALTPAAGTRWKYEAEAVWESGEISNFTATVTIPLGVAKIGHTYRARCRMKDNTGRWSHWSAPAQFTGGETLNGMALAANLRLTELMYNPAPGDAYEFVELCNTSPTQSLTLDGATFTAGISYSFTNGVSLAPGQYVVVVRSPTNGSFSAFRTQYGLGTNVLLAGPYDGGLSDGGETLTLKTASGGTVIFSAQYSDALLWPLSADGAGHALVPLRTDLQTNGILDYWQNWRAGTYLGGSPGSADPAAPAPTLALNEIMAHTDYSNVLKPEYDSDDWIELYNAAGTNITLGSGWYLSDRTDNLKLWAIPATNMIATHTWRVFGEVDDFHNPFLTGFGLNKAGDQVFLSYLPGNGQDRVVDCIAFEGEENGISLGRYADGTGPWYHTAMTRGTANQLWPTQGVVISEIMYHPAPTTWNLENNLNDEFVELYNSGPVAVALTGETGTWRLDGGVSFSFPTGTVLAAGAYLAVVSFDPASNTVMRTTFLDAYGLTNGQVRLFGPYSGRLGNGGDEVRLERGVAADFVGDVVSWHTVDRVTYFNQSPWPEGTDGTGGSLTRGAGVTSGDDPASWTAGMVGTPGSAPAKVMITAPSSGSGYLAPFSVTVSAEVDEAKVSGSVQKVEFRDGATLLQTDTTVPYGFTLDSLTNAGRHRLTAVLFDDAGQNPSPVVFIDVYTNAPTPDAGRDQLINIGVLQSATLGGAIAFNGIASNEVTVAWSTVSGAGTVLFGDASSASTVASFNAPDTYVLCLQTTYGQLILRDYVTVILTATNTLNEVPYNESFEGYAAGTVLAGIQGWYAMLADAAVVQTNGYVATFTNGFPLGGPHAQVLTVDSVVTNRFRNTEVLTNVWMDVILECRHWTDTELPAPDAGTQFGVFVSTNSRMAVWNCKTPGSPTPSNGWTELPQTTIASNQFVRLTVNADYLRVTNGHSQYRLWVNGVAMTNPQTWFAAADTNRPFFSQLTVSGMCHLDDLVVDTFNVLQYRKIVATSGAHGTVSPLGTVLVAVGGSTNFAVAPSNWYHVADVLVDEASVGAPPTVSFLNVTSNHTLAASFTADLATNQTPVWWLNQKNPSWTNQFDVHAMSDADDDGALNWEEYVMGTHPTNPVSVFELMMTVSNGQRMVLVPTVAGGEESGGQTRYYTLERGTNLLTGTWGAVPGLQDLQGAGETFVLTNAVSTNRLYYRGRVYLAP